MRGERGTAKPYLRGKIWWIQYMIPGRKKQERESSYSANKQDAVKLLNQRRREVDTRQITGSDATIGDLLNLFLSDQQIEKRKSYKTAEGQVRLHLIPAFGKTKAADLTSAMVTAFIKQKQSVGYTVGSIKRCLCALHRGYVLGMEASPPLVLVIPKIKSLDDSGNVREGFLTHAEYLRMLHCLPEHQKLLLVMAYHLAMRRGELLGLRWDQIDWSARLIRLEKKQTKGKSAREAPIYGDLAGWLTMAFAARDENCPFIIQYKGHRISEMKRAWDTARTAADLPGLYLHDLRRTAVRNMRKAGCSENEIMRIGGWKTRSVFNRYNITDTQDISLAGERTARYLEAQAAALEVGTFSKVSTKVSTAGINDDSSKAIN